MEEPKIESIEEIAIAVKDMAKAMGLFKELFGFTFETGWDMPVENMRVKSERVADVQFQLLESTSPNGVIARFIKSRGEGIHHIAFRVKNLVEMVKRLKQKGVRFVPEKPVAGSYIFIHPKSAQGVLIELIQRR